MRRNIYQRSNKTATSDPTVHGSPCKTSLLYLNESPPAAGSVRSRKPGNRSSVVLPQAPIPPLVLNTTTVPLSASPLNPIFCMSGQHHPLEPDEHEHRQHTYNSPARRVRAPLGLNILLKFARMYDFGHPRTKKQYDTAWTELRTALGSDQGAGLLLAVSGDQLLLGRHAARICRSGKSLSRGCFHPQESRAFTFHRRLPKPALRNLREDFPTGTGAEASAIG